MTREKDMNDNLQAEATFIRPTPEAVVRYERDRILTLIAEQTNESLLAPALPGEPEGTREGLRKLVINGFVQNFVRFTTADQPIERLMALQLVSETALRDIDAELKDYYMTQVAMIDINAPAVTRVPEVPISTAELEVMVEQVTDEAVSPPRGVAIERLQDAMQKARAFVVSKVVTR